MQRLRGEGADDKGGVRVNDTIIIKTIKAPHGYYINERYQLLYERKSAESTFNEKWKFINPINFPPIVESRNPEKRANQRFELIDKTLISEKFPATILAIGKDWDWSMPDEYSHLSSLYNFKYDVLPQEYEIIDVKFDIVAEVEEEIRPPMKINFPYKLTYDDPWKYDENDFVKTTIDTIIYPEILLHERPQTATSLQIYNILRQYIKENIDQRYATITSDYNFCFAVSKKISLTETEKAFYIMFKGKGKKTREVRQERMVDSRLVPIFEMTHAEERHKGYTPISSITGANLKDLHRKIILLCEETIKKINEPLIDCPHCKGKGVITEVSQ